MVKAAFRKGTGPLVCLTLAVVFPALASDTFSVATYNLDNYLLEPLGTRPAKSAASKAKIRESILAMRPDLLALQEMGDTNALLELRAALKTDGLDYPFWEHVTGYDTNIHVAVLSRFSFVSRQSHTNERFLLSGRRFRVSRGFADVTIRVNPQYTFTLMTAHLKSKRAIPTADEAELRQQEALRLREIVDAKLAADPDLNLIVLGDLNDTRNSRPVKTLLGRGKRALLDTRPAERNGDDPPDDNSRVAARTITWTYFYGLEDAYSRIDYILVSPGMAKELDPAGTWVLSLPNWGVASDHRPVVARFAAEDK